MLLASFLLITDTTESPTVLVVSGAAGSAEYAEPFRRWADRWEAAAERTGAECARVGHDAEWDLSDKDRLRQLIAEQTDPARGILWLVLIGHGTFDGQSAKFNLRGPDVTAAELEQWLEGLQRPLVVINCASCSAPFINRLSAADRVVITATKSGYELNFARFGEHLSAAIADPDADLDKDGQTSLLEAFLSASARVSDFYRQEARLQTETALIDDNGDGRGTPASWFRGIHTTRRPRDEEAATDGLRARRVHLVPSRLEREIPPEVRLEREEIETQLATLRQAKGRTMTEDEYYAAIEPLLLRLARLYAGVEAAEQTD
jgi:hypothetical protein